MKKVILMLCLALGATQLTQAQLAFGIKGGINYNSDSFKFKDAGKDVFGGAKSKTGFHAGIWSRFNVPVIGMYIRPELVYTALKSELTPKAPTLGKGTYGFQKIDIPVLIGKNFLKLGHAFIGPSFQYLIDGNLKAGEIYKNIKTDTSGFTVGLVLGAGIEISKFGIDVRWERGFSDTESKLIQTTRNKETKFDTRVNQIILGVSYNFL